MAHSLTTSRRHKHAKEPKSSKKKVELEQKGTSKMVSDHSTRKSIMNNSIQEYARDQKEDLIDSLTSGTCSCEWNTYFNKENLQIFCKYQTLISSITTKIRKSTFPNPNQIHKLILFIPKKVFPIK
jgi:hypothetical protein